jgi:hypothetical protein
MTTFLLKKYDDTVQSTDNENKEENNTESENEIKINVEGSVAEVVANALNNVLKQKVEITEVDDETAETSIKTLSTEDINNDPVTTFNRIGKDDIVYIHNKGFKTAKEDWFLLNIPNKTKNVFYTVESLIKYVSTKLGV